MKIIAVLYILYIFGIAAEEEKQTTLNLKTPDTTAFQCINCHVDSVSTRLYMPNECHTIKKVVVDRVELWKGTYCPLVLLHHVENKPVFARIITEDPTGVSDVLYEVKKKS